MHCFLVFPCDAFLTSNRSILLFGVNPLFGEIFCTTLCLHFNAPVGMAKATGCWFDPRYRLNFIPETIPKIYQFPKKKLVQIFPRISSDKISELTDAGFEFQHVQFFLHFIPKKKKNTIIHFFRKSKSSLFYEYFGSDWPGPFSICLSLSLVNVQKIGKTRSI